MCGAWTGEAEGSRAALYHTAVLPMGNMEGVDEGHSRLGTFPASTNQSTGCQQAPPDSNHKQKTKPSFNHCTGNWVDPNLQSEF